MKAYKGFDKNMQCRGFQFREGETYHEDEAKLSARRSGSEGMKPTPVTSRNPAADTLNGTSWGMP